jgi:serine protease
VGTDDDPTAPRFGHGTFIAAQIAAAANNGLAGAGIAPRVTILPVRVINDQNFGFFSDVADGIDFAVAQGARVINLSLGGSQGPDFLRLAVERAHRAGVVIVASTGNEAADPDAPDDVSFPSRYPQVIAVGSTSFADRRASYSNFGPGLDLMAPAGDDASFVDALRRDAALAPSFLFDPENGQATYASFWATGTSFAAPQVAGAAALLVALGVRDPDAVRAGLRSERHPKALLRT